MDETRYHFPPLGRGKPYAAIHSVNAEEFGFDMINPEKFEAKQKHPRRDKPKILFWQMFHLKHMHFTRRSASRIIHHSIDRRQERVSTSSRHVRREGLIAITNIRMLIQQLTQEGASTAPKMPTKSTSQETDWEAAG